MFTLNALLPEEVEAIHQASLRVLSEIGVAPGHAGALELLVGSGATILADRVLLPPDLVEACLAKCPRQVSIKGRGGAVKTLGDGSLNFHNLGGARDIFDPRTGQHRYAVLQDVRDATRVLDALPNCNTVTPFFTPQDVSGVLMSLAMYRHALPFTTKPMQGPGLQYAAEARYAVRMAEVIGPPNEILSLSVSPVSPLSIPDHEAEAILEVAQLGIAFGPLPCPTAGTTAPFSIAGAITQQNAEVLAALVLAQLTHPGLPVIYCGRLAMMEPRTGISVWGGLEMGLASAGTVQIGHRYGLPVNVYGFSTNSHTLDLQNGFERALNAMIPALAGADELSGMGEMEAGVSGSFAQMVADNELAASVRRGRRGFVADADALAVDVIAAAMKGSHNFLSQKHTSRYLKNGEVSLTRLAERGTWEMWENGGRNGMAERAQAEAERILREHQVSPLEPGQERALDELIAAAEQELTATLAHK
jgi:trimethylamine---corrinoid protein Co-methyltransferase